MKPSHMIIALCAFALVAGVAMAETEGLPDGQPVTTDGVESVCTGVTTDVRADAAWSAYPLKIEFVGKSGQYLGDETINVSGNGKSVTIHCAGPWVLMKLPAGAYTMSADVADAGHKTMTVHVPSQVIVRFPNAGGEVAPQRVAAE